MRLALVVALSAASLQARALEVDCEPAHPFFCMNIHAGCAGRTEVPTFVFKLSAAGERGRIESRGETSGIEEHYRDARAEKGDGETRVIVRPQGRQGYITLRADGRYIFRHYVGDAGIMSYGDCR